MHREPRFEILRGHVLVVRFDPDDDVPRVLADAATRLAAPEVRGAVLDLAAGARRADLGRLLTLGTSREAAALAREDRDHLDALLEREKPLVAVLGGIVSGPALEIALACDARVGIAGGGPRLSFDDAQLGLAPRLGGLASVVALVGAERALDLYVDGAALSVGEASRLGLVDAVAPAATIVEEALAKLASLPASARRRTQALPFPRRVLFERRARARIRALPRERTAEERIVDALVVTTAGDAARARSAEEAAFAELAVSSTARAAMSFLEHRTEAERVRSHVARASGPLRRIAVVGSGPIAEGWAARAALGGLEVVLVPGEVSTSPLADLARRLDDPAIDRPLSWLDRNDLLGRVTVSRADAVPRPDLWLDVRAPDERASSPSPARPEEPLAVLVDRADEARRGEIAVARPIVPLPVLGDALLERPGPPLASALASRWARLSAAMGALTLHVPEAPGFFAQRVAAAYALEGLLMAAEGVSVELLEDAARDWGFRAGPLSIVDGMTAAAFARLVRDLAAAHGDRFAPRDDVERALREGGPRVRGAFTGLGRPMREEVQTRLALAFVNEAARALDDEIVESAAQADLASVLGVGFPLRRGGPMTYVRGLGPGEIVRRLEHCARRFGHRFAPAESLREERAR